MAKVLLVYPKPAELKNPRFGFSLNMLYLSSILKEHKHEIIDYMDFSLCKYDSTKLNNNILLTDYIIIEIDSFSLKRSVNIYNAEKLVIKIKKDYPNKKIIVFGYDLLLVPRKIKYADYTISSTTYLEDIVSIINKEKTTINYSQNFDDLPFPDRSILPPFIEFGGNLKHKSNLMKSTLIQTSRGCLNSCRFCQRKGWQKKFLAHSVDYVVSEFKYLSKNNYVNIWISDDNFTYNLKRAKDILSKLIDNDITKNMKISCSSWTNIDKEFLELAKKANISIISFGIESANQEILEFYNKKIDLSHTKELINYANNLGLYTVGNFIIGAPMETQKTIDNTFKFALDTPFDQANIKVLDYMVGSDLFDTLPEVNKRNIRHIFASQESGLNSFKLSELKEMIVDFKEVFNKSRINMLEEKIVKYGTPYKVSKKNYIIG